MTAKTAGRASGGPLARAVVACPAPSGDSVLAARLKAVLDASSEAVLLLDLDGQVLLANVEVGRLLRADPARIVGSSIQRVAPPPLQRLALKIVRRVAKKGRDIRLQRRIAGRTLDLALRPVAGTGAEIEGVALFIQDVSAQCAREQAHRHKDALLETIGHAANRLLYESNWQDGLEEVLERIGRALQADRVLVLRQEGPAGQAMQVSVVRRWSSAFAENAGSSQAEQQPCLGQMVARWAPRLAKGQLVAGEASSFPPRERKALAASGVRSLAAIPVFCRDRWWGLLCACSEEAEREWTEGELEAVKVAADTLGAAILRASVEEQLSQANIELVQSIESLKARSRNAELLSEMSELLQGSVQPEEALQAAAECAEKLLAGSAGAIYLQPERGASFQIRATWGDAGDWVGSFLWDDCWAVRRRRAHGRMMHQKLGCRHLADGPHAAGSPSLCVPIAGPSGLLGLVTLCLPVPAVSDAAEYLAKEVADRLGVALANLALRAELEYLSSQDPLTGLFNRRHMERALDSEVKRAIRHGRPVSVLMMDLDHFKSVNDHYGHDAGDAFLREFAAYLRLRFRSEDIACRYGGEEFVVIMPETTVANAEVKSRQLREHVRRLIVEHKSKALGKTTVSVGIAGCPDHGGTPEEILRAADQALYEAKRRGRDRSVVAAARAA